MFPAGRPREGIESVDPLSWLQACILLEEFPDKPVDKLFHVAIRQHADLGRLVGVLPARTIDAANLLRRYLSP
jgi:hypothetical protein